MFRRTRSIKQQITVLLAVCAAAITSAVQPAFVESAERAAKKRPNVVLVMTDDIESWFDENRIKRRVLKGFMALARRHKKFEIAPS